MTDLDFNQLLSTSVDSVLETMFFSVVSGPAEPEINGAVLRARVSFRGRPSGTFGMCLSAPTATLLAASFLGEDEQTLTESQTGQVMCEMANMLCGALLSRLQSEEIFDLGTPELMPSLSEVVANSVMPHEARRSFALEGGILTVNLQLEGSI